MCPSSCPEFDGFVSGLGFSLGECNMCSARVYEGDEYYEKNGKILCEECAKELISPELLELLECTDIKDFFDMLL